MTSVEVCQICDITDCVHIRMRRGDHNVERDSFAGFGVLHAATNSIICQTCGQLTRQCVCYIQQTPIPSTLPVPTGWRCPCCNVVHAPATPVCLCQAKAGK
jgi:hypothetical protein